MNIKELVKKLQNELNDHGENLKVDGDFGPKTQSALKNYSIVLIQNAPDLNLIVTRDTIANKIVALIQKDIDTKLRETNGKNRSPRIDMFNKRAGAPKGTPYCASGAWCAIDDACKELGLKNPLKPTAASQAFRKPTYIPKKYIRSEGELGRKGDVGVLQVPNDSSRGHHTTLSEDQKKFPFYDSVEYNTDAKSGDRDGDGAYAMTRSTIDKASINAGKLFICFTDVPQYIFDYNKLGEKT